MKSFLESFISKIVIVVILATSFTAIVFAASIPTSISYQGTMVAKGGGVVTGRKTIKFAMYSTTTGSVPFWSENHPNVTVSNSQFAAQLGQINPLPVNFFTGQTYLGLSVESDSEMVPRQQLVSVPYAYSAVNAISCSSSQLANIANSIISTNTQSIIPVGTIVAFGGSNPPPGWLLCDGRSLPISDFQQLYNVILAAHGSLDSSHFNLPDYRARFLRGVDYSPNVSPNYSGRDADAYGRSSMSSGGNSGNSVGSVQSDSFAKHQHSLMPTIANGGYPGGPLLGINGQYANNAQTATGFTGDSSETRPKNAYVNWIIKSD